MKNDFIEKFKMNLELIEYPNGFDGFKKQVIILGAIISLISLCSALFYFKDEKLVIVSLILSLAPTTIGFFYITYLVESRKKRIEKELPDLLLMASSLPERTGIEKLITFMATKSDGPLSKEFVIVKEKINMGTPITEALISLKKRNGSLSLNRSIDLLINSLESGAEMSAVFRETAEDFLQTNSIIRERSANSTIEKYTLLLAGGVLVPLILGKIAGMISEFNFSGMPELGIGMSELVREKIVEASLLGNVIYIAEYALIASAFIAFQEGQQQKAILYAIFLLPLSLGIYFFGKGF